MKEVEAKYCSHCGKKLRRYGIDQSSIPERVYCRRCRRFVWVNDDSKYDHIELLLNSKLEKKAKIKSSPKTVEIVTRFCQYCRTKITHTVAIWDLAHDLECPKCGEITFYEDVVRAKCRSCDHYEPRELGTYDKCKDPGAKYAHVHMNEAECSGFKPESHRGFDPMTGKKIRSETTVETRRGE